MRNRSRMTIDELAQRTGVSSRNIRYYQTRGLLPPPTVEGRTGYYRSEHVERLQLIQELQAEGLNLQAIGWLLGGATAVASDEVRQLKRAVLDGWTTDAPVERPLADVIDEIGEIDAATAQRSVDLELTAPADGDGRINVLMPSVLAAGRELAAMGVPVSRQLDVLALMREHAAAIAAAYLQLFDEAVLAPWDARGRPAEEWPEIRAAVDRIRPLAGEALLAVFRQTMSAAVASRLAETADPDVDG
jgi:DNA-binding transcriptional MerR regulator